MRYLTRSFVRNGQRVSYVNIYARPLGLRREPPFEFLTARESGFEGIACVDDTARAAMLALQLYEHTGAAGVLRLATEWLRFVEYMQEPDGRFTNFICDVTGRKNRSGQTSHTGGGWWTARAMLALATAYRVTEECHYLQLFQRGRLAPTSDMKRKALHALALMELYVVQPTDEALQAKIARLCDAIASSGPRYMVDRKGNSEVHMWGYHQLQAVARAGRLFSRLDYLAACETTVKNLVEPVVRDGFYYRFPTCQDHQCVYVVSSLVLGLEELYRATGKCRYRALAFECASWLDGRNPSGQPLYDPQTGCCSDGLSHTAVPSLNCGAESAIEAGFIELARLRLENTSSKPRALCGSTAYRGNSNGN